MRAILFALLIQGSSGSDMKSPEWYLPGVTPVEYAQSQAVPLFVNKLTSTKTQLPYRYYTLPYCEPDKVVKGHGNLGSNLLGDSVESSGYDIKMLETKQCQTLCTKELKKEDKTVLKQMIDEDYQVNWILDNLPGTTKYARKTGPSDEFTYMVGFPVGLEQREHYFIHNHARIIIQYYSNPEEFSGFRIVGFEIEPHSMNNQGTECGEREVFDLGANDKISFTYDVIWKYTNDTWSGRWERYVKGQKGKIHWFSILNSVMIVLFLSSMVAMILLRTLHRDISRYNELATAEDAPEETGWKLVHGDVFRKPPHSKILAVCVGSGVQILGMSLGIVVFACLGLLSLHFHGYLVQSMVMFFVVMGSVAGYHSARLYKMWGGVDWKTTTLLTALLFPGVVFSTFFLLNLFIWYTGSSGAVPFKTIFTLLVLWCGISVPLVFLGAYLGYRRDTIELPVRTNAIPRHIPQQPWFAKPLITVMIGGVLPFGAVFTELFFILSSIWQHQFYYLFGFLLLVLIILVITCVEISIALTYFQLTSEDHQWWWRAFMSSASSGLYVFLYALLYKATRLQIDDFIPSLVYFGYTALMAFSFSLLTGASGLLGAFYFVHIIYGSIKID